tara:strand:- start:83 stop:853 length:771 start_codon:yes stop_codon:yes gene_type:complete
MKKNKFLKEVKRNIARLVVNQRKKLNEQQAGGCMSLNLESLGCNPPISGQAGSNHFSSCATISGAQPTAANVGDIIHSVSPNNVYEIISVQANPSMQPGGPQSVDFTITTGCPGSPTDPPPSTITCYGCENGQIITDQGFSSANNQGICGTINGVTMYDDQNHSSLANCGSGTDPSVSDLGCCEWCNEYGPGGPMAGAQSIPPAGCEDWMCGDPDYCPSDDGGRGEEPREPKGKRGRDRGRGELRERFQKLANIIK